MILVVILITCISILSMGVSGKGRASQNILLRLYPIISYVILKEPPGSFVDQMEIRGLQVSQSVNDTTISWFTVSPTNYSFYYGTSSNNLNMTKQSTDFKEYHEVVLTDLIENQVYYYRIFYCNQTGDCRISPVYNFLRYEIFSGPGCIINQTKVLERKNLLIACDIIIENGSLIINNSNLFFDLENSKILVHPGNSLSFYSSYLYANRLPNQKIELENLGNIVMNKVNSINLLYNFKENSTNFINSSSFTSSDTINFRDSSTNIIENSRPHKINLYDSSKITLVSSYITETYIHSTKGLTLSEINGTMMTRAFLSDDFMINLINSSLGKIFFIAYDGTENNIRSSVLYGFVAKKDSKNKIINSSLYNGNNSIVFEKSDTEVTQTNCYLTNVNFSTTLMEAKITYNKPGSASCNLYASGGKNEIKGHAYIPRVFFENGASIERFYPIKVQSNGIPLENVTVMIKKGNEIISSGTTNSEGEVNLSINFTSSSSFDEFWIVIKNRKYQKITLLTDTRNGIIIDKNDLPDVTLVSPANGFSTKIYTINFSCNASDDTGLKSLYLYINDTGWRVLRSISCSGNYCTLNHTTTFPIGTYKWNCLAYDIKNLAAAAEENSTFSILNDPPNVTLNSPPHGCSTNDTSITFNCSAFDDKKIISLSLHTDTSGAWRQEKVISCNATQCTLTHTIENISEGQYNWNCLATDNDYSSSWNPFHYKFKIGQEKNLTINLVPPTPENGSQITNPWVLVKANTSETIETCELEWDHVIKYNMEKEEMNETSICYKNVTNLVNKTYEFLVHATSLGNSASSEKRIVTIVLEEENESGNDGKSDRGSKEKEEQQENQTTTKQTGCLVGSKRCLGNLLQECQTGLWQAIQECAYGCNSETLECKKESEISRCSSKGIEKYISGEWVLIQECAYGCDPLTIKCIVPKQEETKIKINFSKILDPGWLVLIGLVVLVIILIAISKSKTKRRKLAMRKVTFRP